MDASNRARDQLVSGGGMTKEKPVLQIARAMHKGCEWFESFNAYQCIKGYFLDHEMEHLIGIAG